MLAFVLPVVGHLSVFGAVVGVPLLLEYPVRHSTEISSSALSPGRAKVIGLEVPITTTDLAFFAPVDNEIIRGGARWRSCSDESFDGGRTSDCCPKDTGISAGAEFVPKLRMRPALNVDKTPNLVEGLEKPHEVVEREEVFDGLGQLSDREEVIGRNGSGCLIFVPSL